MYIPLGGSKGGTWMKVRNTFIIFIVSGFWHGANWTFIVWGFLNALYFLPLLLTNSNRINLHIVAEGKYLPSLKEVFLMSTTFGLTVFAWIFFRANSIEHAMSYISGIFSTNIFSKPEILPVSIIILTLFFLIIEWIGREGQYALAHLDLKMKRPYRYALYYALVIVIFWFGGKEQQFIYFQF